MVNWEFVKSLTGLVKIPQWVTGRDWNQKEKKKSDTVKMGGTLCRQKQRNRGEKGETHELIGPWQSKTVPYNVLMVSGSDWSHWKLCQITLSLQKVRFLDRGMWHRTRAMWLDPIISVPLITYWKAEWGCESTEIFHKWTLNTGYITSKNSPEKLLLWTRKGEWSQSHLAGWRTFSA